jgi:hypothetical protein
MYFRLRLNHAIQINMIAHSISNVLPKVRV